MDPSSSRSTAHRESASPTGGHEEYDALVSTMPLDLLVGALVGCLVDLGRAAEALEHNAALDRRGGVRAAAARRGAVAYFPDPASAVLPCHELREYAARTSRAGTRLGSART